MKAIILSLIFCSALSVRADTYTGTVSGVKHFQAGAVAVDLDGRYPDQKMTLYVPAADAASVGTLPTEGVKVTATGEIIQYKGRPEIKITDKNQWKW